MFSRLFQFRSVFVGQHRTGFSRRFKSRWVDGGDHATHNDLPIPEGDWRDYNSRRNAINNLVLASGTAALAISIYLLFLSGTVNFNFSRPDHYRDNDAVEDTKTQEEDHSDCTCAK